MTATGSDHEDEPIHAQDTHTHTHTHTERERERDRTKITVYIYILNLCCCYVNSGGHAVEKESIYEAKLNMTGFVFMQLIKFYWRTAKNTHKTNTLLLFCFPLELAYVDNCSHIFCNFFLDAIQHVHQKTQSNKKNNAVQEIPYQLRARCWWS